MSARCSLRRETSRRRCAAGTPIEVDELAAVVPHPSTIVCCGHNYAAHIAEMGIPWRRTRRCSSNGWKP
ncbi:MAG: hypothetical protein L0I76_24740 [Pseudonocardia sp.]|nr:hypothetical protein [Pseudonocardia sp.]